MEADQDRDGKISFEEFTKMVENTDVSMSMTLGMPSPSPDCHLLLTTSHRRMDSTKRDDMVAIWQDLALTVQQTSSN